MKLRMAYTSYLWEVGQASNKTLADLQTRVKKNGRTQVTVLDVWPTRPGLSVEIKDIIDEVALDSNKDWNPEAAREMIVKDQMAERAGQIDDIVRREVSRQIEEGNRRSYTYSQMQAGFAAEGYEGVTATIDKVAETAEASVRDHAVRIANMVSLTSYRNEGVSLVEVIDGDKHAECAAAGNAVWSVSEAMENLAGRSGCTRMFLPIR
jgi:translation initiation factor 2 alpha subunit (eIF-2alpha)